MNYDEIECIITLAYNDSQEQNDERKEALVFIGEFDKSIDGVTWAIDRFNSFNTLTILNYALLVITHWCKNKWDDLSGDLTEAIRDLIFTSPQIDKNFLNSSFKSLLGTAQVVYFWNVYPDYWPTFWSDILSFPINKILNFLSSLGDFVKSLTPKDHEIYNKIKNQMRTEGSDAQLAAFTISQLNTKSKQIFEIYGFLLSWVNMDYIFTDESFEIISDAMSNEETTALSLNLFKCLIDRGMPEENKIQLIESLQIVERIKVVLEDLNDPKIIFEIARLIASTGKFMLTEDLMEYAVAVLEYDDCEIADVVSSTVLKAIKALPEIVPDICQHSLNRLIAYYETNHEFDSPFAQHLTEIIGRCIKVGNLEESVLDEITSVDSISGVCAALSIANFSFAKIKAAIDIIIPTFAFVLEATLPFEEKQMETAIILFAQFITTTSDSLDNDMSTTMFTLMLDMLTDEIEDEFRGNLSKSFVLFTKKCAKKIQASSELIIEMAQTQDHSIIQAAGILVQQLTEEEQDEAVGTILGLFEPTDQETVFEKICAGLQFVRSINMDTFADYEKTYFEAVFPIVIEDDEVLAAFIKSVYSALRSAGIGLIIESLPKITGIAAANAMCKVVELEATANTEHAWAANVAVVLQQLVFGSYLMVTSWDYENETMRASHDLTRDYFMMCAKIVDVLEIEFIQELLEFVLKEMNERFRIPTIFKAFLDFATSVTKLHQELGYPFASASLLFLYASNCDLTATLWKACAVSAVNLHIAFGKENFEIVSESLSNLGASQEIIEEYRNMLGISGNQRPKVAVRLYLALQKIVETIE